MKINYREIKNCVNCRFAHFRRDGEITRIFCNQDNFGNWFNFGWWKNGKLTSDETNTLFLEEENHRVYSTGICDEWEKIEEIYD